MTCTPQCWAVCPARGLALGLGHQSASRALAQKRAASRHSAAATLGRVQPRLVFTSDKLSPSVGQTPHAAIERDFTFCAPPKTGREERRHRLARRYGRQTVAGAWRLAGQDVCVELRRHRMKPSNGRLRVAGDGDRARSSWKRHRITRWRRQSSRPHIGHYTQLAVESWRGEPTRHYFSLWM
jgi:hypothetical protein